MARTMQPQDLIGSAAVDSSGAKIGKIGSVYYEHDTREAAWVTVKTGLFGGKETFVPLAGSRHDNDGLHVAVHKERVSDAPQVEHDGQLSPEEGQQLYRHYGMRPGGTGQHRQDATQPGDNRDAGGALGADGSGRHSAGNGSPAADESITRSEERLKVGTEEVESGHVRLRKYVVTEEQQVTVPVSHEEVRIEREPITDTDAARGRGSGISEEEQDVVLHEERPVVDKESVPVERVRMGTERVTDEETVSGEVRKEQIDIDDETQRREQR